MSTVFVAVQIVQKTKEQKKLSSLAIKVPKFVRESQKPGKCVTVYSRGG
jgi:hypothetical protein